MNTISLLAVNLAVVFVLTTALWAVSIAVKDSSIVDIFWGSGFVVIGWVSFVLADGAPGRRWLLAGLTMVWGLRLTIHLARRNLGKGEDFRYQEMRAKAGDAWPLRSLWAVFWIQGILMWLVSLPIQVGQQGATASDWLWLVIVGAAIYAVGLFFETVGDLQLTRFKADAANKGTVMDRGLWRYTRHPNYFGDFSVWWGLYLIALSNGIAWWTIVGPLIMSVLLIRVSGAGLLEKSIGKRRPGYDQYIARTSGFLPRPPRRD